MPIDHFACLEALGRSTDGLAVIAKDVCEITRLKSDASEAARFDAFFKEASIEDALTEHLRLASRLLADLRAEATVRSRALRPTRDSPGT